jgi:hypothetical protein
LIPLEDVDDDCGAVVDVVGGVVVVGVVVGGVVVVVVGI